MNTRNQIICAWCGVLCLLFMLVGPWPAAAFRPEREQQALEPAE